MSWNTKKLQEVCDFQSGLWKGKKEPFISAYVIRNTNFTKSGELSFDNVAELEVEAKQLEKRTLQPGDIILEKSGGGEKTPVGRVCYFNKESEKPFSLSNFTARLRVLDRTELYPLFLHRFLYFLYLSGKTETMQKHSTGIRNLQLTKYKEIDIPLPPLPVQKQIVVKLDEAFANIDKAISATQKNIENAEALFQQSLNSFFNQKYNKEYSLGDVCEFIGGSQPPKSEFEKAKTKENIRLIQIRDYKSDKNIVYIPKELAKRHCTYDDVMIGRYGPPVFQILRGLEGSYNVALMKAVPNSDFLTKDYLFYFLKNPKIQNYIILLSKRAAGQSGLNKKTIEPYLIYLPSLEEQESIVFRTKSIEEFALKLTTINQKKLSMLNSLKTSFLNKAFSGELTKDAA